MQTSLEVTQTELNLAIRNDLGQAVINYGDTIENAHHRTFGISSWYKAYMISEDFKKLPSDYQKESFDTYDNLISMFSFMETKILEYDKSLDD